MARIVRRQPRERRGIDSTGVHIVNQSEAALGKDGLTSPKIRKPFAIAGTVAGFIFVVLIVITQVWGSWIRAGSSSSSDRATGLPVFNLIDVLDP